MFEDRLKQLREARGLSRQNLSNMLDIKPRTYASYENNEREPDSEILIKFAKFFGVSVDYLLGLKTSTIINDLNDYDAGKTTAKQIYVSAHEEQIIMAYRTHSEMQQAVDKLLGINKHIAKPKSVDISAYTQSFAAATGGEGLTKGKLKEVDNLARQIAEIESKSE